jgi:hypothetical protein
MIDLAEGLSDTLEHFSSLYFNVAHLSLNFDGLVKSAEPPSPLRGEGE